MGAPGLDFETWETAIRSYLGMSSVRAFHSYPPKPDQSVAVFYADLNQDGKMDPIMDDNAKATGKPVTLREQREENTVAGVSYTVRVVKDGNPFRTLQVVGGKTTMSFRIPRNCSEAPPAGSKPGALQHYIHRSLGRWR